MKRKGRGRKRELPHGHFGKLTDTADTGWDRVRPVCGCVWWDVDRLLPLSLSRAAAFSLPDHYSMNPSTALILLGLLPLALGCGRVVTNEGKGGPVIAQWSGPYGGSSTGGLRELRTAEQWLAFWQQVGREPPRALDTSREMGIALFLGEKTTGGYGAEITGVRVHEGRLVMVYRESSPAPDAMVTQALTSPWVVAIVPRSEWPVTANNLNPPRSGPQPVMRGEGPVAPDARTER
jgi:hypothetical protein